jgi:hypothetical protein
MSQSAPILRLKLSSKTKKYGIPRNYMISKMYVLMANRRNTDF